MEIVGVRVEMPSNQPIVLLRELSGERYVPIWIGAVEATAIAFTQQGVTPPRPLTHDLIAEILRSHQIDLERVHIVEVKDNIFHAELVFSTGLQVNARPSDAIAIALRLGAPVFCSEQVLTEASVFVPDEQEDEVERFREFLDHVSPEDFEEGREP